MNDLVIKSMKESSNELLEQVKKEFGDYLLFDLVSSDYDKAGTSYVVRLNAFGFYLDVIYDFESEQVVVFNVESYKDVMKCDVSEDTDVSELFDGIYFYALWLHHNDSVGSYTIV